MATEKEETGESRNIHKTPKIKKEVKRPNLTRAYATKATAKVPHRVKKHKM